MLRFRHHRPLKSFSITPPNKLERIIMPRWYSKVEMGDYSYMNDAADIQSFRSPQTVKIGKYCSIGECSMMVDGDHNIKFASTYPFKEFGYSKKAPLNANVKHAPVIHNDVWIADGVVIYGGVTIGNGAVVAGNTVVTKDVPPYALVVGNPGRVAKYRFPPDIVDRLQRSAWWDLPHQFICDVLAPELGDVNVFLEKAESFHKA